MMLRRLLPLLLAGGVISGAIAAPPDPAERVVVFGTGHRTIPKGAPVTTLDNEAYSQDLIEIVAAAAGIKYRMVEIEKWSDLLAALADGRIDVIPTVARLPEREKIMLFSVPHVRGTLVAVTRAGAPAPASEFDLAGKRIPVIPRTVTEAYLQHRRWQPVISYVAADDESLREVAAGQVDAAIINQFTAIALIHRYNLANQVTISLTMPDSVTDFCMAVRPGEEALLGRLNDGLFLAAQRGEVRRNFEKWFPSMETPAAAAPRDLRWLLWGGGALVVILVAGWAWVRFRLAEARRRNEEIARLVQARTQELAEANRQLRSSEEKFSRAFQASPDAVVLSRMDDGTILEVNEGFTRIFGYLHAEVVGRTSASLGLWADPAERQRVIDLLRSTGRVRDHAAPYRRKDGAVRSGSISIEPIRIGGVDCLVNVVLDITEREAAAAALRESEARFRALVESAPEAIVVFDPETRRVTDANENALRLFETTREDLLVASFDELAPDRQPNGRLSAEAAGELLRRTLAGESPVAEWLVRGKRGRLVPVELHFARLPAGGRQLVRGSLTDVTERRRLEEQLRHAQRMESIGRLAGGIAHDFNNILTVIQLNASILQSDANLAAAHREAVEQINQSALFAAGLTRQLLVFSRKQVIQRISLDVAAVIQETSRLLRRLIGEDIVLEVQVPAGLPPVLADHGMLEQVLLNLAVNSRDAMPRGGRLRIAASVVERDDAYRQQVPQALAGRFICIAVADTGVGIPPGILPRIFEPFFTTKEVGKGTGLGLATVYGILQQHQGWIEVDSTVGSGTEFRLHLPCREPGAELAPPVGARPPEARVSGSILVVEDDALVRASSCLILQRNGFKVFEAASPAAALELWAAHRDEIQLVFTDMVMPGGMTGRELAAILRRDREQLKVLFTSGYTADQLDRDFVRTSVNFFLPKPFGADELVRGVSDLLGRA